MPSFAWLLPLTLRSTAVLVVALALVALLRRVPAAARHRVLTLTAGSLLLLPALPGMLPRWELRLPVPVSLSPRSPAVASVPHAATPSDRGGRTALVAAASTPASAPTARVGSAAIPLGAVASGLWLLGALASLAGLFRALRREARLVSEGRPLAGPWTDTLAEVRRSLGLSRPVRLLTCAGIDTPVTGGWRRPVVLLPKEASSWSEERRRVVLQHELVHVLRGDVVRRLAWRVVVALYWFHPLARVAGRKAILVGEHACDETVLDLGTRPSTYARHLLEIAECLGADPGELASALPMVDRSQLERRLFMILDPDRSSRRGRALAGVCLALLAGTVAVAGAAGPAEAPPGRAKQAAPSTAAAKPAPAEAAKPAAPEKATPTAEPGGACGADRGGDFSGTYSEGPSGTEWNGVPGGDFALQQSLGSGQRLCALVRGRVRFDERTGAIVEVPAGGSVSAETRGRNRTRRVLVTPGPGGPRYEWWLDGASLTADDAARAWLADALEVVAGSRAIGSIQGQVGSLQGEIGSIQGEVGGLQGKIGSVQGEVGSLQGKVGSIQGEEGGLQGEIGGHQGAIGGLEASRWQVSPAEKTRIDSEIARHQAAIEKLQAELSSGQLARRLADAEAELRSGEQKGQREIAALEREIEDVHADARISALQQKIADLRAGDRIAEIERRTKPALDRLKASL